MASIKKNNIKTNAKTKTISKREAEKITIDYLKDKNYCTMQITEKCKENHGYLPETEFFTCVNPEIYSNRRFNICKDCMTEYVYNGGDELDLDRFKKILRVYDIPFLEKEMKSALTKDKVIGAYMKNINLNHGNKTWLDSDGLDISLDNLKNPDSFVVTKEMIKKWGKGYNDEDYQIMEDIYDEWVTQNKSDTLAEKKTFKYIAMKEFDILRARERGDNTDKLEESLRKFMSNAMVVPKEIKESITSEGEEAWGLWIRDIEKKRPAEVFGDRKLYFDYDGLLDYLNRFVFRPLKNILTKTKEYDKEFNVEDNRGFMDDEIEEYGEEKVIPTDYDEVEESDDFDDDKSDDLDF